MILEIRKRRPFYGTRRVAAELARSLGRPVNRKRVRRAYRLAGWSRPAPSKADAKARWKPIKAARPNQVWQTDITYVWCGQADGWCYCFNILDIFIRRRIAYRFDTLATADVAVDSLVEAVATAKPDCSGLTIRRDNGSRYAGKKFRKATPHHLGIRLKSIWKSTPQQNGPHRIVPRRPQARVHLAARPRQLPAGRGRHIRSVPGLQPEQAALGAKMRPAGRVYGIMGGGA